MMRRAAAPVSFGATGRTLALPTLAIVAVLGSACSSSRSYAPGVSFPAPVEIEAPKSYGESDISKSYSFSDSLVVSESVVAHSLSSRSMSSIKAGGSSAPSPPTPVPISPGVSGGSTVASAPKEGAMVDVEARVNLVCEKVFLCGDKARELIRRLGGQIINDVASDAYGRATVLLSVRMPSGKPTSEFLEALEALGHLTSKLVTSKDVGKEYFDAQIVLENLESTLRRYQDILAKAKEVKEILAIETELNRVRMKIERTKGDLIYLRDRASRSTIYLTIAPLPGTKPETSTSSETAKFYPGLRLGYAFDNRGDRGREAGEVGSEGYLGFSFSLQAGRFWYVDVDLYRKAGTGLPTKGIDLLMVTTGGDFYSDYLGGGKRRYLNPFIGFRAGYVRMLGKNEMALGMNFGVELFRTKAFILDLSARSYALFASSAGIHALIQPNLGANFAF